MRTIKECITDGMTRTSYGDMPISLSNFIRNMAYILVADADMRLADDVPNVTIEGETYSGKAKDESSAWDIRRVLIDADWLRGSNQFFQFHGFLTWLLDQYEPNDEEDDFWCDLGFLGRKWNEYAGMVTDEKAVHPVR